jgi:hypothetical protein
MEELFQSLVGEALNHVSSVSFNDTDVNPRRLCAGGMAVCSQDAPGKSGTGNHHRTLAGASQGKCGARFRAGAGWLD